MARGDNVCVCYGDKCPLFLLSQSGADLACAALFEVPLTNPQRDGLYLSQITRGGENK